MRLQTNHLDFAIFAKSASSGSCNNSLFLIEHNMYFYTALSVVYYHLAAMLILVKGKFPNAVAKNKGTPTLLLQGAR